MIKLFKIAAVSFVSLTIIAAPGYAQKASSKTTKKNTAKTVQQAPPQRVNPIDASKEIIERIYNYLDGCTPYELVDAEGNVVSDFSKIDKNTSFRKGDFGINTYEWGVTYSGMLLASEVLEDSKYSDYVYNRLRFLGNVYPYVQKYYDETGYPMRLTALHTPRFLDDCGAMCAAMIKATLRDPQGSKEFRALLDNWFNFCMYKEYRFGDGLLARNRPTTNSVWLDDMYMGITPIAYRGRLSQAERGDLTQKFYSEAVNQVLLFKNYLWKPEKGMYRHGWIEGMTEHPDYHWARANGWAMLTMCDVLDAIPENVQGRNEVLQTLKTLIHTIGTYQSPEGTWHQLLDKTETYLETSASAMYVYCIAHAINNGWIDKTAYQDIAKSGWNAVMKQVNAQGQVENTCVGTGLGWTNTFYAARPVSVFAAHGYGPVLLAAAEMIKLYKNSTPASRPAVSGLRRQDGKPVLFLVGDSTCAEANGKTRGWGQYFGEYMNDDIVVFNRAIGGLSSRTYFNRTWSEVLSQFQEGDYVIIQLGHNDTAPLNTGRARGTLSGTGDEPTTVVMEKNGGPEVVYSYGNYIRRMIRQAKMRGVTPIVLSPTSINRWTEEGKMNTYGTTYQKWSREVAQQEGVEFVDVHEICTKAYEQMGQEKAQEYLADSVHTFEKGAKFYCEKTVQGLKSINSVLAKYVK